MSRVSASSTRSGVHQPAPGRTRRPAGPPTPSLDAATNGSSRLGSTRSAGTRSSSPTPTPVVAIVPSAPRKLVEIMQKLSSDLHDRYEGAGQPEPVVGGGVVG